MIASFLYLLFIYPIEVFIETVFSLAMKVFDDPGLSIICVSLFVQLLVLPLYKKADERWGSVHPRGVGAGAYASVATAASRRPAS